MGSENKAAKDPLTVGAALRRARKRRGWSQMRLIHEIELVSRATNMPVASKQSLKAMLSRWERDHQVPDGHNRILLCAALGVSPADVGLSEDPDLEDVDDA